VKGAQNVVGLRLLAQNVDGLVRFAPCKLMNEPSMYVHFFS
jgi:hypothetical protein